MNKIHSQGGIKNSLFQFCLTISKPFPPIEISAARNFYWTTFILIEMSYREKRGKVIISVFPPSN